MAFSPDGNTIASGSWDNTIHLWDASTGTHRQTLIGHARSVESVAFSPDGTLSQVAVGTTRSVYGMQTLAHIHEPSQHIQVMFLASLLVPMETLSQVAVGTTRSIYGMQALARTYEHSQHIQTRSTASLLVPMETLSQVGAARSVSGMQKQARIDEYS